MSKDYKKPNWSGIFPIWSEKIKVYNPENDPEVKEVPEGPIESVISAVDHPPHYNKGNIEVIDFILDHDLGFCAGNVVKYLCRAPYKGTEVQDLKKARFYLNSLIDQLEDNEDKRTGKE